LWPKCFFEPVSDSSDDCFWCWIEIANFIRSGNLRVDVKGAKLEVSIYSVFATVSIFK